MSGTRKLGFIDDNGALTINNPLLSAGLRDQAARVRPALGLAPSPC